MIIRAGSPPWLVMPHTVHHLLSRLASLSLALAPVLTGAQGLPPELTPVGAEAAGNAEGSVPPWTGGLVGTGAADGHYADPYPQDRPLFSIHAETLEAHAERLSPGQRALLERHPGFRMDVYPSRRSAAFPPEHYAATAANLERAGLAEGGRAVVGTRAGVPFPMPETGLEVIWNHLTAYAPPRVLSEWDQLTLDENGAVARARFRFDQLWLYHHAPETGGRRPDLRLKLSLLRVLEPPRIAGLALLTEDHQDTQRHPRRAWLFSPEERRVRLVPSMVHDNPGLAADGLRNADDFWMFDGSPERYDWRLVGKRELYIPYNAYRLQRRGLPVADVVGPGHPNPDLLRYEVHRVWVVEATLRPGAVHPVRRRTLFVDEDSWLIHVQDQYDRQDRLWRVLELHSLTHPDVPTLSPGAMVLYELPTGRALVMGLRGEVERPWQRLEVDESPFTANALRRRDPG